MKKKLKKVLIIILVIVALVAIACCAYFIILKVQEKNALKTVDTMFTALKAGDEETLNKYTNIGNSSDESSNETTTDDSSESDSQSVMDDEAMTKTMLQNLGYEVTSKDTKLNNCTVQVNVTNKDFKTIFSNYVSQAFSLALSSAFGSMTDEEMSSKLEEYFAEQYNSEDIETITTQITLTVKKENGEWKIYCDDNEMINAILPGYTETISSISSMFSEN